MYRAVRILPARHMPYPCTCTCICICACLQAEKSKNRLDLITFSVNSPKDLRAMREALASVAEYFEVGLSIVSQFVFLKGLIFFKKRKFLARRWLRQQPAGS